MAGLIRDEEHLDPRIALTDSQIFRSIPERGRDAQADRDRPVVTPVSVQGPLLWRGSGICGSRRPRTNVRRK